MAAHQDAAQGYTYMYYTREKAAAWVALPTTGTASLDPHACRRGGACPG
jgi:hypothetical protein